MLRTSSPILLLTCITAIASAQSPPAGFSVVAKAPGPDQGNDFGQIPRMVLDANGDPMVSFVWRYNGITPQNPDASALYFVSWNRAAAQFNAPVQVAISGDIATTLDGRIGQSLARDASNNMLGIAYRSSLSSGDSLHVALSSDNGKTWLDQVALPVDANQLFTPTLALANGTVYVACYHGTDGLIYTTGSETDVATNWVSTVLPVPTDHPSFAAEVSLAVDASGAPAVAYLADSATGYDTDILFWRPGDTAPVVAGNTNSEQNDRPDLKLAFFGTSPRIAFQGARDSEYFSYHNLWAAASSDNGVTWGAFVLVPADNNSTLDPPIWLAIGSKGQGVIQSDSNGGSGDQACGEPKISQSPDFVTWTTCGVSPAGQLNFTADNGMVAFGANDNLISVFQTGQNQDLPYGVELWIQPPAGIAAPAVPSNGIVSAADYLSPVAPGSLVSIFGTNLTSGPVGIPGPLPLPDVLLDTTVSVNGSNAKLLYASPNQINFQAPAALTPGIAQVVVTTSLGSSPAAPMTIAATAPGVLQYNGNHVLAQNSDFTLNQTNNPAAPGSYIIIYATGQGEVTNPVPDGTAALTNPLSYVSAPVSVTIGTTNAPVLFAGLAPNFVGLTQVNVTIPATLAPGDYPLVITIGTSASNTTTVSIGAK